MSDQITLFGAVIEGAVIPRVQQIIEHEAAADELAAASDAHRWEAARLIADELAAGKSQRQLAAEIGKSQTHVSRMARVWEARESLETQPGAFNEAYQALAAKPVPAAIESPETQSEQSPIERIVRPEQEAESARPEAGALRRTLVADILSAMGASASPEAVAEIEQIASEREAQIEAARSWVRDGADCMPPATWKPELPGSGLTAERNRLGRWELTVAWEAGIFLNWCEAAGIRIEGKRRVRLVFPERLTYPDDGTPVLKMLRESGEWGPDDEHAAALGHFAAWWYTGAELREMTAPFTDGDS